MSIVDTGGTFLGCLREKNGYFNFFPIALFVAAGLHILTRDELNTLFTIPRRRDGISGSPIKENPIIMSFFQGIWIRH